MIEAYPRVARSLRSGLVENLHFGLAAVATPDGKRVAHLGDTSRGAFLRSAAKPIQLLPLLMAGGAARLELTNADIALMGSSHSGTPEHVSAVQELLTRFELSTADLGCGVHAPMDRGAAKVLRKRGERPSVLHNNCSANHLGQLIACRILDLPKENYRSPEHPLQQRVLGLLSRFADVAVEKVQIGVDGCGLPSFRLPVERTALLYARLADPEAGSLPAEVATETRRILEAMAAHPEMVAGAGRFTTALIRVTGGRVIGKEGAEGFYGIAVRGPVALGVAIKILDGSEGCRDGVVIEVLRQAGCLSQAEFDELSPFYSQELSNCRGEVIGDLAPDFELIEGGTGRMAEAIPSGSVA